MERVPISLIRSKLFVPGSRPELFPKAAASAADSLSLDLEDSVAEDRKAAAREAVVNFLRGTRGELRQVVIVRVNGFASGRFESDVAALKDCGVDLINVPKVESAADVRRAVEAMPGGENLLANIETPKGLRLAAEIAAADSRVAGLQIGFVDLLSQCGIDPGEAAAKYSLRLSVRLAAAEAGIAVFDSAYPAIRDLAGFRAEAEAARRLGMTGKSCIHPSQVDIANEVFTPPAKEIEQAEKILAAAREHAGGVFQMEGQMIDRPILDRARAIVALAASRPL